ncbi:MAG: alcohol dehydrogenase catalytic domain-containing protein [Bryobacterales bacterium]|nr:alcohol dehydrogenase catalytic domain-containing protein [Bryobacterales bacterium]
MPTASMKANVFRANGKFGIAEKPIPAPGFGEVIVRVNLTTICGTDIHIVKGEYPVRSGLTIGHEAVGVIHELGDGVFGYEAGQRVLFGAITPCGQCEPCLDGHGSQCGGALGGWRLGNTLDGTQAEYVRVPFAQANLALIPAGLSDEQVILLADIASTGFSAAESGRVRIGDNVAIFGQGPIGLCATLGAHLMGAARIFAVDKNPFRLEIAQRFGATDTLLAGADPANAILEATRSRGVDVAIEALGIQETFSHSLAVLKPGGVLSSVGVYSHSLSVDNAALGAGLADKSVVTTLCPGGKERMQRLMRLVESGRIDLTPLLTHHFYLDQIADAYDLFGHQRDGVLKVAIHVHRPEAPYTLVA